MDKTEQNANLVAPRNRALAETIRRSAIGPSRSLPRFDRHIRAGQLLAESGFRCRSRLQATEALPDVNISRT